VTANAACTPAPHATDESRIRVVLTGAHGQLGRALVASVPPYVSLRAHGRETLDVRDAAAVERMLEDERPAVLLNAAAYTAVDAAEQHEEDAHAVNTTAVATLARCATARGVRLVHLSTDYVFGGDGGAPYGPEASVAPCNAYGRSKAAGERAVLALASDAVIVRTAWLHSAHPPNFVCTVAHRLQRGEQLRVVTDQIGTPTRAAHLADALWRVVRAPTLRGVLHCTDAGVASWYDVAQCVADELSRRGLLPAQAGVLPVQTTPDTTRAVRPRLAVLNAFACWEALGITPEPWSRGVLTTLEELLDA